MSTRSGRSYLTPIKTNTVKTKNEFSTKSARKRLVLAGETNLNQRMLTEEDILQEICCLQVMSPFKPAKTLNRSIASPLHRLSLQSPNIKKNVLNQRKILNNSSETSENKCTPTKSPGKRVVIDSNRSIVSLLKDSPKSKCKAIFSSQSENLDPNAVHIPSFPSPSKKQRSASFSSEQNSSLNAKGSVPCTTNLQLCIASSVADKKLLPVAQKLCSTQQHQEKSYPLEELVCREVELNSIKEFLVTSGSQRLSRSMYISGAPGTGKTASVKHILSNEEICNNANIGKTIIINCMSTRSACKIFQSIAMELGATSTHCKKSTLAADFIMKSISADGPMTLLVLDEIDQLDSKNQEVLYTMFGWTMLKNSRLILIGIANSLDLTDRLLPRLQTYESFQPQLINFRPYTKDQLVKIVETKLLQIDEENQCKIHPVALQFCCRKVAAMSGDARKALDICRRAIEIVEKRKSTKDKSAVSKVGMKEVADVIAGVYDSVNICGRENEENSDCGFPLQQKMIVCCLVLITKNSKCREPTLGKLHEEYVKICRKRQISPVNQSEFFTLCDLVESRGMVTIKKAKPVRLSKIKLNIEANEVEFALQGKALLSSILQNGI